MDITAGTGATVAGDVDTISETEEGTLSIGKLALTEDLNTIEDIPVGGQSSTMVGTTK